MWRAVVSVLAVLLLSGCGSSKDDNDVAPAAPAVTAAAPVTPGDQGAAPPAAPPPAPAGPRLPDAVPRKAQARANPADAGVVRRWSAALRRGDVARAAAYFAQPSKVQNGTPVVTLRTRGAVLAFNASLPCGAVPTSYGAARGFTIVTFRLTERVGGDCAGAVGHRARCAIRVQGGRIAEWYRLADPPKSGGQDQRLSTPAREV
jgi:limonene-1,2-epoxide hydrolase